MLPLTPAAEAETPAEPLEPAPEEYEPAPRQYERAAPAANAAPATPAEEYDALGAQPPAEDNLGPATPEEAYPDHAPPSLEDAGIEQNENYEDGGDKE